MKTLKYSRQREAIKDFLCSRKDHPTADMVYENIRKDFPNVSLGTVYRNLNLLVELGQSIKITSQNGADRFDATTTPHYHVVCSSCGKVDDVDIPPLLFVEQEVQNKIGGRIDGHETKFFGVCPDCLKAKSS